MSTLNLPEPRIQTKYGARTITARYDTGLTTEPGKYDPRVKKILLSFSVHYTKAGINYWNGTRTTIDYYGVSVQNETEQDGMIGFVMGSGLGLAKIEQPSNRFSRKRLDAVFAEWREKVEGLMSLDDEQVHLLDEDEQKLRAAILPYWNGEKAGLA